MNTTDDVEIFTERHYSPQEVSQILDVSPKTVIRLFSKEPGVITWGSEESLHKRGRKIIRIPKSVLERFHQTHRALKPEPSKFQSRSQMRKKTTT